MNKIINIRDKQPKKALTPKQITERAYKEHFKNTSFEDEPDALASGKTTQDGQFVHDNDDNGENE